MPDKIDSDIVGLHIAEESSLRTLPGTPDWYEQEPNEFSDFGADYKTVRREPINPSRQKKKGVVVGYDVTGGFTSDFTANNLLRYLQGFFFADAREKTKTDPLNGTAVPITGVVTVTDDYQAASGLDSFTANELVYASGFTNAGNNGLKVVSAAAAGALTVTDNLVDETPGSDAKIEAVGYQAASGDLDVVATASSISLTSTTLDFTTLGLIVGEWIFVGDDSNASYQFVNNAPGFARISAIAANTLTFDETTWTAVNETGTGLTIRLFYGTVIKNENTTSLITRRTYQLERSLGNDGSGTQAEYLEGAVPNELKLNIPQEEKMTAELNFVPLKVTYNNGTTGLKSGNRISALDEEAINTSSNIYQMNLYVDDPAAVNEASLFAYVTNAELMINNNVSPNKAVGVLGAFEATAGDFEVSGSLDAYFSTVGAVEAIPANSDVSFNVIESANNQGAVFDIPLLTLGNGKIQVEKNEPIKVPLDKSAAKNANGYTLLYNHFAYLPDVAMATG